MRRRSFLAATAGTALSASIAGCSGLLESSDDGTGGDEPPYDRFVPGVLLETPQRMGATLDYSAVNGAGDQALWPRVDPDTHDPLVVLGASLSHGVALGGGVLAERAGLGRLVEEGGATDRVHVGGAYVLEGDHDVERIADDVAQAGFAATDSYRGFQRYESDEVGALAAVDEEFVVLVPEDESIEISQDEFLEATIDTARGEAPRASEEFPTFEELGGAVPTRDFVGARYDETGALFEPDESEDDDTSLQIVYDPAHVGLEGDAVGYSAAFDVTADRERTFHLAIRYADAEAADGEDAIREAVAPSADDPSVSVDGPLAVVEGTYERSSDS